MRTGVAYMGHHNPDHMARDLDEIAALGCRDVFLAAQENDAVYFPGKLEYFPPLCRQRNLRPIAIFWGALNYFGGGKSSHLLLEYAEGYQMRRDGERLRGGCYINPTCAGYIKQMIDSFAALGFEGYFIDEPSGLDCFCPSCAELFQTLFGGDLVRADEAEQDRFRAACVGHYIRTISSHVKTYHFHLETFCCLMEQDRRIWPAAGEIPHLDNLGTDLYWVNDDRPVAGMIPLVRQMAALCRHAGKKHHEWLQCWGVRRGREGRIREQGELLLREQPDALYVWAYRGQRGTSETCEDPALAWDAACRVLRAATSKG